MQPNVAELRMFLERDRLATSLTKCGSGYHHRRKLLKQALPEEFIKYI